MQKINKQNFKLHFYDYIRTIQKKIPTILRSLSKFIKTKNSSLRVFYIPNFLNKVLCHGVIFNPGYSVPCNNEDDNSQRVQDLQCAMYYRGNFTKHYLT